MDLFSFIELDEFYECSECDGSNEIKTFPLGGKEKSTQLNELHEVKWFDEFNEVSVCFFVGGGADSKKEKLNEISELNECT